MQPLDPKEAAIRMAAERKKVNDKVTCNRKFTERRQDWEFKRDLKLAGLDIREVRCE